MEESLKTTLDREMERRGFVKYTYLEKEGLFGISMHDKDLMAEVMAHNVPYIVEPDHEYQTKFNSNMNTLYIDKNHIDRLKSILEKR